MLQDLIAQALGILRGAWRYRWYTLLVAWTIAVAGWVWVATLPDQYRASARVYVDTGTLLKPLLRGLALQTDEAQRIRLMTRTLMSRPTLEKLARMTDLDLEAKTAEQMDALIGGLSRRLSLRDAGRSNLYTISYRDESPERAKLVAQSLLTLFVEGNLGDKRKDADSAGWFLQDQIRDHEQRLVAAEERVKDFKAENLGLMPSDGADYYARLQGEKGALEKAQLDLRVAENRRRELERQIRGEVPTFGLMGDAAGISTPYDGSINELEKKRNELLIKYTEQHPDVIGINRRLERLREQREAYDPEVAGPAYISPEDPLATNPVYQQLRLKLGDVEAEIAAKRVVVENHDRRVEEMQKYVDRTLEVEAELKRLNRDYGLIKKNYDSLVARYESLKLSEKVDNTGDTVSFRVIDPPRVPLKPSGPDRVTLSTMVFGGALGAGLAIALLLSQLIPVFDDRRTLTEATGLMVLGSVNMVWTDGQIRKQRLGHVAYLAVAAILFAVYGGIMANYLLDIGLI